MTIDHCSFLTVPDPSLRVEQGRIVRCDRPIVEHPVEGSGRFVNHCFFLDKRGRRVTDPPCVAA